MTARAPKPLPDRVQHLEIAKVQHDRRFAELRADTERSASQAEGAIEDVRLQAARVRVIDQRLVRVEAIVLAMGGQQGEILSVLRDMAREMAETRGTVESARTKASGAHRLGEQALARASLTEEQVKAALDEAAKQALHAKANPPTGDELRELRAEFLKAAKSHVPFVTRALVAVIVAALVVVAAWIHSCSPGGL